MFRKDGVISESERHWFYFLRLTLASLQLTIPMLLIISSGVVSCFSLRRNQQSETADYKRSATITIVCLTVACTLVNLPFLFQVTNDSIAILFGYNSMYILFGIDIPQVIVKFNYNHSIPFNSIVNTVIYISRIRKLRRFIWKLGHGVGIEDTSHSQATSRPSFGSRFA